MSKSAWIVGGVLLATLGADLAWAQAPSPSGGIYTCVDRNGRRLTADRPIAECLDREQRELGPSGIVRRQIGPSLTEHERAAQEAQRRKEAKDHGEGGTLVGAPLKGRVLIVDDVMSAGTAARESIAIIKAAGATPHAVAIALDRQEKATENGQDVDHSAVQYVRNQLGMQVCAIARLADLLLFLEQNGEEGMRSHHEKVLAYRQRYGVNEG